MPVAPAWVQWGAWVALLLAIVFSIRAYFLVDRAWPLGSWDAVAVWDTRAAFLYEGYDRFPALSSKLDKTTHPQYPPLLPSAVAAQYAIAGGQDAETPAAISLAFWLGLIGVTFAAAGTLAAPWVGALAAALVLASPTLLKWGPSHGADIPAAYLLLAVGAGLVALERPRRAAPAALLVGWCLGMLAWIKDEGLMLAALTLACWLGARWLLARSLLGTMRRSWPWLLAGAAPGILALLLFRLYWPVTVPASFLHDQAMDHLLTLSRWKLPLRALASRLIVPRADWPVAWWPVFLPLAMAALSQRTRRVAGRAVLLWLVPLLALGVFVVIYVITPYDQAWHISSSIDRVLLQLYPSALVGALVTLAPEQPAEYDIIQRPDSEP